MTEYFDKLRRQVADIACGTDDSDAVVVKQVRDLEAKVIRTVSLCTGDREFPGAYRERIQGAIAYYRLEPPGGSLESINYLITMKSHRLFDELHSVFHELATERIRVRFGLLTDNPADIVKRRDDHDSCGDASDDEDIEPPEPGTEMGNPVLIVELYDPHRPLCSDGKLSPRTKMRLELLGACTLSTIDMNDIIDMVGDKACTEHLVKLQVWNDGVLVQDTMPEVHRDCDKCHGQWKGRDYKGQAQRAMEYRRMESGPLGFLKKLVEGRARSKAMSIPGVPGADVTVIEVGDDD